MLIKSVSFSGVSMNLPTRATIFYHFNLFFHFAHCFKFCSLTCHWLKTAGWYFSIFSHPLHCVLYMTKTGFFALKKLKEYFIFISIDFIMEFHSNTSPLKTDRRPLGRQWDKRLKWQNTTARGRGKKLEVNIFCSSWNLLQVNNGKLFIMVKIKMTELDYCEWW